MIPEDPDNGANERVINTKRKAKGAGVSMREAKNTSVRIGAYLTIGLMVVLSRVPSGRANSFRDSWYFTAEEIDTAYQYQENYGVRMRNPLPAKGCMYGEQDFVASYRQTTFLLSCRFITETIRHLKEMLTLGAARYLFPLDADHGHLAVPSEVWARKYSKLSSPQLMIALLQEPTLVALYHTAEHLEFGATKTGENDETVKRWKEKRNVLGFFDGRPIQILPPHPEGQGVGMPAGYVSYGGFNFLANHQGELLIFHGDRAIAFDVSLEEGEEPQPSNFSRSLNRTVPR
jgi:hypothetical protein